MARRCNEIFVCPSRSETSQPEDARRLRTRRGRSVGLGLFVGLAACVRGPTYTVLVGTCSAERDVRVRTLDEAMQIAEASEALPIVKLCPKEDDPGSGHSADTSWNSVTVGQLRTSSLTLTSALPEPATVSGIFQYTWPRTITLRHLHVGCGDLDIAAKTLSLSQIDAEAPAEGCAGPADTAGLPGEVHLAGTRLSMTDVTMTGSNLDLKSPQLTLTRTFASSGRPVAVDGYYARGVVVMEDVEITVESDVAGIVAVNFVNVDQITAIRVTLNPPMFEWEGRRWTIPEGLDTWSCDFSDRLSCPGLEPG